MSDLLWYLCEIKPDRKEEDIVLRDITEGVYTGRLNILLPQCIRERWNRVLHRILHIENCLIFDHTKSHLKILDRFWITLTCPFLAELITNIILNYNFSLTGLTYEVTLNDTFTRLRSLHNAGVCVKGLTQASENSLFFILTFLDSGLFPQSGVFDKALLFAAPRTLLNISKIAVRLHLGPCQRQILKARIRTLEIPITLEDYLFEKF